MSDSALLRLHRRHPERHDIMARYHRTHSPGRVREPAMLPQVAHRAYLHTRPISVDRTRVRQSSGQQRQIEPQIWAFAYRVSAVDPYFSPTHRCQSQSVRIVYQNHGYMMRVYLQMVADSRPRFQSTIMNEPPLSGPAQTCCDGHL